MVVERDGELHLFESTPDGVFTSPLNRRSHSSLLYYNSPLPIYIKLLTIFFQIEVLSKRVHIGCASINFTPHS
jgi:hypothetical protein